MSDDLTTAELPAAAARGVVNTLTWQIARTVLQFATAILLARLLGPREIGLIAMVLAITSVGEILKDFGLSLGAVQAASLSHAEKSNLFWINCALGVLLALVFYALAWPIAAFYGQPDLVSITQLTAVIFVLSGFATQFQTELHRNMRFGAMGLAEFVSQAVGAGTAIWIALERPTYIAIVAQQIVQAAVFALIVFWLSRWRPAWPRRSASIRHILKFGAGVSGTQLLAHVSKNVDNIAIGYRWGAVELGLYSRAFQLVTMPLNQMLTPFTRVAVPLFSRIRHDREAYVNYMLHAQSLVVAGVSLFFGLLFGQAELIVRFVLGEEWLSAAPIMQILCLGAVFKLLCQVPAWIFLSHGETGQQFKLNLVGQPVIVLCILLGLPYGSVGVAWGGSVGYVFFWLLQMHWASRVADVPMMKFLRNGLGIVLLIGGPAALAPLFVERLPLGPLAAAAASTLLALVYVLCLILALPARRWQVMMAWQTLRSSRRPRA